MSAENITIANVSPGKGSLNLLLSGLQEEEIVYLHVDADYLSSHLISSTNLVLIIDFNTVACLLFPTSSGTKYDSV